MRKLFSTLLGLCVLVGLPTKSEAVIVFQEGFSGSTVSAVTPAAPTSTSTDYAVLSSKNATGSSIGSTLDLTIPATSAGFAEMQALFTTSPVTLGAGDSIELRMRFQSTHLLDLGTGNTQTINVGLFNSGGSYPVPGGQMANGGLGSGTSFVSGYAQNWTGYVGRVGNTDGGNSSQIYTRDAQTDTTDENQDVLFSNSGTGAYDNPSGTTVAGSGAQINLADGQEYMLTFKIINDGSDITVEETIADSSSTVYSLTGAAPSSFEYTTFDSLAFGFRGRNSDGQSIHWTVSDLSISTFAAIPEASSFLCVGLAGAITMLARRRRSS